MAVPYSVLAADRFEGTISRPNRAGIARTG